MDKHLETWRLIDSAIENYLAIFENDYEEFAGLKQLCMVLDGLVATYHRTVDVEPETEEVDAPSYEPRDILDKASRLFPSLDFYPTVFPDEPVDQAPGMGYALDDIADIAGDFHEARWYAGQGRVIDAIWNFRWGYQNHWGQHLHDLRRYLYYKTLN